MGLYLIPNSWKPFNFCHLAPAKVSTLATPCHSPGLDIFIIEESNMYFNKKHAITSSNIVCFENYGASSDDTWCFTWRVSKIFSIRKLTNPEFTSYCKSITSLLRLLTFRLAICFYACKAMLELLLKDWLLMEKKTTWRWQLVTSTKCYFLTCYEVKRLISPASSNDIM